MNKNFLRAGAIGLGLCIAGGVSYKFLAPKQTILVPKKPIVEETNNLITYVQARIDPDLRQSYLEQILENLELPEYVKSVSYKTPEQILKDTGKVVEERGLMCLNVKTRLSKIGTKTAKSDVFVLPRAYETKNIKNDIDFINTLVDHEFNHAKTIYHGLGVIENSDLKHEQGVDKGEYDLELLYCVYELLACENQLKEARKKKVSEANGTAIMHNYRAEYYKLWESEKNHPKVIKRLKSKFFKDWMFQVIKKDSNGSYMENTKTNKKYYLDFLD